jgi:hypothetical protein
MAVGATGSGIVAGSGHGLEADSKNDSAAASRLVIRERNIFS